MTERPLSAGALRRTIADAPPIEAADTGALPADASLDAIARAASSGDIDAVARLYDHLIGPIYRYVFIRLRSREDAEDVTALVFERIVGALPRYHHNGRPFAAWAFRIARNAVIDHGRRHRPTEQLGSIAEPSEGSGLDAISVHQEELRELRAALGELTADQREAILLRYAAGLSAEEAAAVMGRRAGTIRGLTFRAIEALRRHLHPGADR